MATGQKIIVFLQYDSFQLLLYVDHVACIRIDALHLSPLWGTCLNFYVTISGSSVASNTSMTLVPLLAHGSLSPTSTEIVD